MIDPAIASAVKDRLGSVYEEMLGVMIDLAVPPIFLFGDERPRLAAVRERARASIESWEAEDPTAVGGLIDRLPHVLQVGNAAQSLLEAAPWSDYFEIPPSAFAAPSRDAPVLLAVPELVARLDDDGLVDVSGLDARPHGLFVGDFSLHYHQLLRRSFGSSAHYDLVGTVLGASARHPVTARLAVDERRLRFRHEHEEILERDYWYGPPLSDQSIDDLDAVGETVHGDPEGGTSFINPYAALSVRWTRDGVLKTVEIEEYVPPHVDGAQWVLSRYLHAIRDTSVRAFVHCDGAVKAYAPEVYPHVQADFAKRGKSQHYRKVFRLDGRLPTDTWSVIAAQWFRGNGLVLDYLASLRG